MLAIFLDIETTGLDPYRQSAIDIAIKVLDVATGVEVGFYQSLVKLPVELWEKRDLNSMKINGYTWEELEKGQLLALIKNDIIKCFTNWKIVRGDAVFICQNPGFDRAFFAQIVDVYTQEKLNWPYHWLDFASMYWALFAKKTFDEGRPFPKSLNLSKNEIARINNLPTEAMPHKALNGVNHLIECYKLVVGFGRAKEMVHNEF